MTKLIEKRVYNYTESDNSSVLSQSGKNIPLTENKLKWIWGDKIHNPFDELQLKNCIRKKSLISSFSSILKGLLLFEK